MHFGRSGCSDFIAWPDGRKLKVALRGKTPHFYSRSKPHVSQDERPELFDVLPLELAVNRALAPGDVHFDFLRLGDFSEIVHFDLVDGVFDQSAARFFALVQATHTADFHRLTV